jgi:hypothetical protein
MEELAWIAAVGVVALVPPIRRRLPPVGQALLAAGLSTAAAALRGLEGVLVAAMEGETGSDDQPAESEAPGPAPMRSARSTGRRPRVDTSAL